MLRAIGMAAAAIVAPVCLIAGLYVAINSEMGERIAQYASLDDKSAATRALSLLAVGYLRDEELVSGVSTARIEDITTEMSQHYPLVYIENPWVLMCMHLGVVVFPVWVAATVAFFWRLVRHQPFALKLAVINYFLIASTFNSFAVKNSMYSATEIAGYGVGSSVWPWNESSSRSLTRPAAYSRRCSSGRISSRPFVVT